MNRLIIMIFAVLITLLGCAKVNEALPDNLLGIGGDTTKTHTITVSVIGGNGVAKPTGSIIIEDGGDTVINFIADGGYTVSDVQVNGNSKGSILSYSFNNVTGDSSLVVNFRLTSAKTYKILVTEPVNGTISPSGNVVVDSGGSQKFIITPSNNYSIEYVTVNSTNKGAISEFTFDNVTSNQSIGATFVYNISGVHTISATVVGGNGTLSPMGSISIANGTDTTISIIADSGYVVEDVKVGGVSVGAVSSFKFINVTSDTTIEASFKLADATSSNGVMYLIRAKDSLFEMGSNNGDSDEKPVHTVKLTKDFYMDSIEVTQKMYDNVMSSSFGTYSSPDWNSDNGLGDNYPAYNMSWYDAALYCNSLSKNSGKDTVYTYSSISGTPGNGSSLVGLAINLNKNGYRLPTEAEWEYACRGGTSTDKYWGSNSIADYLWYNGNSSMKSHEVGQKTANSYHLYDMNGNVWEWCNDYYNSAYYSESPTDNPTGPIDGTQKVLRGGAFNGYEDELRSTLRNGYEPENISQYFGFRTVLNN